MAILESLRRTGAAALALAATAALPLSAQEVAIYSGMDRMHPVWAENGMVAAQERVAAEIGRDILEQGGNAIDAGVAVAFALAVTLPRAGNLGGGGFMLVHDAETGETHAIDYREMAPAGATRDMFLDAEGNADSDKSRFTGAAAGVPGTVAGMKLVLDEYGSMEWADVIAPAIRLAEEGGVQRGGIARALRNLIFDLFIHSLLVLLARRPGAWRRGGGSEAGGRSFW